MLSPPSSGVSSKMLGKIETGTFVAMKLGDVSVRCICLLAVIYLVCCVGSNSLESCVC